jgi:hypothetical protein
LFYQAAIFKKGSYNFGYLANRFIMRKIIGILLIFLSGCAPQKPVPTEFPSSAGTIPRSDPTGTASPTASRTPTLVPTPTGLGISQAAGALPFQVLKFTFVLKADAFGQDVYIGTLPDKFAEVQLFGPKEELNQAVVVIWLPQPPKQAQSTRMTTYLETLLSAFASDWSGGLDWLNSNLNKTGETKTQFGGKEAILNLTPSKQLMTVEFTIRIIGRK